MRAELVERLVRAHLAAEDDRFLRAVREIAQLEEDKGHHKVADSLRSAIESRIGSGASAKRPAIPDKKIPRDQETGFPLVEVAYENLFLSDLILPDRHLREIKETIEFHKQRDRLRSYGVEPRSKVLFCGPPGTGKTFSARVVSSVLDSPLISVNFDSIVSSYLGSTSTNLRRVFDFIGSGDWVVLFDEFDVIGKRRDDPSEHGEIKRVVNNFMKMLDQFEGESLILAATNHPHLLDYGIWRRFDHIIQFPLPGRKEREELFRKYLSPKEPAAGVELEKFVEESEGMSAAAISSICREAIQKSILNRESKVTLRSLKGAMANQRQQAELMERDDVA